MGVNRKLQDDNNWQLMTDKCCHIERDAIFNFFFNAAVFLLSILVTD